MKEFLDVYIRDFPRKKLVFLFNFLRLLEVDCTVERIEKEKLS